MNPAELHNAKDEPAAPSLQTRLDSYIRQMAPHQRQREGGKLLIEAAERIKRGNNEASLLNLLADIRAAVGDPEGKLMQDELVRHCRELAEKVERLEQAASDALMHLETNYDIDGNRMADSDAAEALRNGLRRKDNQ